RGVWRGCGGIEQGRKGAATVALAVVLSRRRRLRPWRRRDCGGGTDVRRCTRHCGTSAILSAVTCLQPAGQLDTYGNMRKFNGLRGGDGSRARQPLRPPGKFCRSPVVRARSPPKPPYHGGAAARRL